MAIIDEYDDVKLTSSNLAKLPRELVFEIMARMNLSICSMVNIFSSSWFPLVTNPRFLIDKDSRHHHPNRSVMSLLVRDPGFMLNEFTLVQEDITLGKIVSTKLELGLLLGINNLQLNTIHGLMCFWRSSCADLVYLCNPLTDEWARLPYLKPASKVKREIFFSGFGYSPNTNQYKVVGIAGHKWGGNNLHVDVYTIGTSRWRRIDQDDTSLINIIMFGSETRKKFYVTPVLVNGVLHWLYEDVRDEWNHKYHVLCFDVEKEKLDSFQLPNLEDDCIGLIGELNGCLTMYKYSRSEYRYMSIWVLRDYSMKDSWVKLGKYYKGYGSYDPIHEIIHVNDEDDDNKKVVMLRGSSACYSFKGKTEGLENINEVSSIIEKSKNFAAQHYGAIRSFVPSFLSPRHMMLLDH